MQPKLIHGITRAEHRRNVRFSLGRAQVMTWRGFHPVIVTNTDKNGIRTVRAVNVPVASERRRK